MSITALVVDRTISASEWWKSLSICSASDIPRIRNNRTHPATTAMVNGISAITQCEAVRPSWLISSNMNNPVKAITVASSITTRRAVTGAFTGADIPRLSEQTALRFTKMDVSAGEVLVPLVDGGWMSHFAPLAGALSVCSRTKRFPQMGSFPHRGHRPVKVWMISPSMTSVNMNM